MAQIVQVLLTPTLPVELVSIGIHLHRAESDIVKMQALLIVPPVNLGTARPAFLQPQPDSAIGL